MDNPFYRGFVTELEKIAALPALAAAVPAALKAAKAVGPSLLQGAGMTAGSNVAQKITAPKPKPGM